MKYTGLKFPRARLRSPAFLLTSAPPPSLPPRSFCYVTRTKELATQLERRITPWLLADDRFRARGGNCRLAPLAVNHSQGVDMRCAARALHCVTRGG